MFQTTVSLGDVVVLLGLAATVLTNYFGVVRRVDRISDRQKATDDKVEELRHGRGLVLGPTSDWPPMVRKCFGYGDGAAAS